MNKYGDLVEQLIALKDMHRDLSLSERDTIDAACNALVKEGADGN